MLTLRAMGEAAADLLGLPRPPVYGRVDYSVPTTPAGYRCAGCGAAGCKLWRDYAVFLEGVTLRCGACALREQGLSGSIDQQGQRADPLIGGRLTDAIGWRVPAVLTEAGDTFWGYTSVPVAAVAWWRSLPTETEQS